MHNISSGVSHYVSGESYASELRPLTRSVTSSYDQGAAMDLDKAKAMVKGGGDPSSVEHGS
jgi:hypothetical protein